MENITRPKRGSHEIRTKCENFSSFPQCCGLREINALLKQTLSRLNLGIAWLVWRYYLKMKSNGISECAAKRTQKSCLEDNPARGIYIGFPRPRFNISSPFSRNFFSRHFLETFRLEKVNGILFMIDRSKYRVMLLLEVFFFFLKKFLIYCLFN